MANRVTIRTTMAWTSAGVILLGSLGCEDGGSRRTTIARFPRWPYQKYQTLAVVPFKVPPKTPSQSGVEMADLLERNLHQNPDNTFRLYTRAQLKSVLTEQEFSRLADLADQRTAIPPGRLKAVQAIVVGTFPQFEMVSKQTPQQRVVPVLEQREGKWVKVGDRTVVDTLYLNAARVAARMQILDTATGEIVFTHEARPQAEESRGINRSPRHTVEELAGECLRAIATEFLNVIAVVRVEMKLKSNMLLLASEYYDGKWRELKNRTLGMDGGRFFGVVRNLPPECTGNPFRLAVMKKDQREPLAQREFVWAAGLGERGESLPLDAGDLYRRAGPGPYELKLYSGETPALIRAFEMKGLKN